MAAVPHAICHSYSAQDEAAARRIGTALRDAERNAREELPRRPNSAEVPHKLAVAQSMLGEHAVAMAAIEAERAREPESHPPLNGPAAWFLCSVFLVRARRAAEGYAQATRLLQVPFGAPSSIFNDGTAEMQLQLKDDPHHDPLIDHPPRL